MAPFLVEDFEAMDFDLYNLDPEDEDWHDFQERLLVSLTTPRKETLVEASIKNASTEGGQSGKEVDGEALEGMDPPVSSPLSIYNSDSY